MPVLTVGAVARGAPMAALDLPNWNEALSLELEWEQAPAPKAQPSARTQGVGRVKAGAPQKVLRPILSACDPAMPTCLDAGVQGTMAAAQHKWQADDAAGMRAEGLDELPNALEAEYWLRRATVDEQAGKPAVRPVSYLPSALQPRVERGTVCRTWL